MKLSVIVPLLNERESLQELRKQLGLLRKSMDLEGNQIEIILNDNASDDGSFEVLRDWANSESDVIHEKFERRVTFQQSIIRGFRRATGDCAVVFQGDLQDPWELIPEFMENWVAGDRVIVSIAKNKHSSTIQSLARRVFYSLLKSGSAKGIIVGFQDFYLLDRDVYKKIAAKPNHFIFIRGIIARNFQIDKVLYYERSFRSAGKSKFRLGDKYDLALDALLIHNQAFTRGLSLSGIALAAMSCGALLIMGTLWVFGVNFGAPGWLSTVGLIALFFGIFSFATAIQLEYLRRLLVLLGEKPHDDY